MARKGNQQKNGLERNSSNHKVRVSESCDGSLQDKKEKVEVSEGKAVDAEELPNGSPLSQKRNRKKRTGAGKEGSQRSRDTPKDEKAGLGTTPGAMPSTSTSSSQRDPAGDVLASDACTSRGVNEASFSSDHSPENPSGSLRFSENDLCNKDVMEGSHDHTVAGRSLKASALSILKVTSEWLERQKPLFTTVATMLLDTRDYIRLKTVKAYPIVCRWLGQFGNLVLLVSLVWLDCSIRGLNSFMRLGTPSFFAVIWCSILSVMAMIGISKFIIILAIAAILAVFVGFTIALLVIALFATLALWMYGSFWTTGIVIVFGGIGFMLKCERVALFVTTVYSIYCATAYVGWLGLFLALNLSFISSDVLIHLLKNNVNEQRGSYRPQEQTNNMQGQPGSFPSEAAFGRETDRSPGIPSTSGGDGDLTSEEEVVRLLNCTDHYSALGLPRYDNIDISLLKREYRRKAMLVHPDKNMGDEKAVEAFKKLQNAYEVLLDSLKREAYNDELKREELLNWFRGLQSSQMNGRPAFFASGSGHSEADGNEPLGELRRIACKKCRNFHIWIHINRSKSRARWCQECQDFHQAKDGDGWVEQSCKPFLFGMLQKVDTPTAYVCAESRIYDATEWFICQGMRCPANTHKPSFHVNTSVTSKHGAKGSGSGQKGAGGMPSSNMEESMTEEEFMEWLQNAMQSGMFEATAGGGSPPTESPFTPSRNWSKSSSGGGSSSSTTKKKKKGKKQW